jgi:hypothetical protein
MRRNTNTCGAMPFMAPLTMPTTETARPPGILGMRILSFWGTPDEISWRPFWEQLSSDGETKSAEEHAPAGGDADDGADEATDRREDPWNASLS